MKKVTLALAIVFSFSIFQANAQKSNWKAGTQEINVGVKPFHLGPTSLGYKAKITKKNWLRLGITDLRFLDGETGVRLGIEKQKNLIGRTRMVYGLEAGTYFDYDKIDNAFASYNVDLGIPVGVQFHLSKRILFGLESRPSIGLFESFISEDGIERENNFGAGVNFFNGIKGTLGYRF